MPDARVHKGIALFLLCLVQFMVVLDIAIVNVALPSIKTALDFGETSLSWVINAYTLTFGGLLLLGGRMADLLGRRRIFIAGLLLFSAASAACGFANSETTLIAARAVQGIGAAFVSPAALSILVTTFEEGPRAKQRAWHLGRDRRLRRCRRRAARRHPDPGAELVLDLLHQRAGRHRRRACGSALPAGEPVEGGTRSFDLLGAVLATGGMSLLVYGLVQTVDHSWSAPRTIGLFVAAAVDAGRVHRHRAACERAADAARHLPEPVAERGERGALMLGASIFSMFFLLTLYMQQILGYSPLQTGVGYLLVSSVIIVSAGASQALRHPDRRAHGARHRHALTALGLLYFSRITVGGSYLVDLTPGFILTGVGLGFSFVPVSIAALVGVKENEAGIASGILNTSQQIGGALGTAILSTVAFTEAADYAKSHFSAAASNAPGRRAGGARLRARLLDRVPGRRPDLGHRLRAHPAVHPAR